MISKLRPRGPIGFDSYSLLMPFKNILTFKGPLMLCILLLEYCNFPPTHPVSITPQFLTDFLYVWVKMKDYYHQDFL